MGSERYVLPAPGYGRYKYACLLYEWHTLCNKIRKFENMPNCLFGMCFGGGGALVLKNFHGCTSLGSLALRDDFGH